MIATEEHVEALTKLFCDFRDHLGLDVPSKQQFRDRVQEAIRARHAVYFLSACQRGFLQL